MAVIIIAIFLIKFDFPMTLCLFSLNQHILCSTYSYKHYGV